MKARLKRVLDKVRHGSAPDEVVHYVGDVALKLPASHRLPEFHQRKRLYDRFPLVLAEHVPPGLVVDVGANVGDTVAALSHGKPKDFVCIEPDPEFLRFLRANEAAICAAGSRMRCIEAAVGPAGIAGALSTGGGTGTFVPGSGEGLTLVPLDTILAEAAPGESLSLIKCDVDGFDGAALLSGAESIARDRPLLFFENEVQQIKSARDLAELYGLLSHSGYDWFTVFDNFGAIILETSSIDVVMDLNAYVYGQNGEHSDRTIYYTDVLASAGNHRLGHLSSIASYRNEYDLRTAEQLLWQGSSA